LRSFGDPGEDLPVRHTRGGENAVKIFQLVALDRRNDGFLGLRVFEGAVLGFATNIGFVDLDGLVLAAQSAGFRMARVAIPSRSRWHMNHAD